ncbi:MAG TPA: 4-(cytidine 5'-diphospho)-2-C-methyl-D-erythritol kinase [Microbacteriaceae bacterium]|nr:4-(cytidine 5'-diphospho)-2-C-methyl-D-erythritol kinase [Microbacteriaceae bacterium]
MDPKLSVAPVSAKAPGKINICFSVGSLRPDGTRGVATLYQAVSIYDTVIAHPSADFSLQQVGSIGYGTVSSSENNLAMRSARLLAETFEVKSGVRLEINKKIPRGAGMSGGSADAAAALVACNELWGLNLERAQLHEIAVKIGADVSFALDGGTAVGTGHGDEFSQALSVGTYHWVIVPVGPRLDEDTALSVLDKHRHQNRAIIGDGDEVPLVSLDTLLAIRSGSAERLAETVRNDVQAASFKLEPELARVCEYGEQNGALVGVMLAMGPALAFLVQDEGEASKLQHKLSDFGQKSIAAWGPVGGARLTETRGTILEGKFF